LGAFAVERKRKEAQGMYCNSKVTQRKEKGGRDRTRGEKAVKQPPAGTVRPTKQVADHQVNWEERSIIVHCRGKKEGEWESLSGDCRGGTLAIEPIARKKSVRSPTKQHEGKGPILRGSVVVPAVRGKIKLNHCRLQKKRCSRRVRRRGSHVESPEKQHDLVGRKMYRFPHGGKKEKNYFCNAAHMGGEL